MIELLFAWWHAYQRHIDLIILWPACKHQASKKVTDANGPDYDILELAKALFAFHCFNDKAWQVLGGKEIIRQIDELE